MWNKTNKNNKKQKFLVRYLPNRLTRKDKNKQRTMLLKSRRLYKKGKYYTRQKVKSFKSKESQHVKDAEKIYNIDKVVINDELSRKTGCTKQALEKIVNKGEGAYYSSGSRPNQTAQSWGIARLASAITGGKAATIDYSILKEGCREKNSIAIKLANKALKKYAKTRKMPKTQ
jgi:hypothetical protein